MDNITIAPSGYHFLFTFYIKFQRYFVLFQKHRSTMKGQGVSTRIDCSEQKSRYPQNSAVPAFSVVFAAAVIHDRLYGFVHIYSFIKTISPKHQSGYFSQSSAISFVRVISLDRRLTRSQSIMFRV